MPDYVERLLTKHRTRGVLVDAGLLLVYVVGAYDPLWIDRFKHTSAFAEDDFELLDRLLGHFDTAATTPPVLTEVSNFLGHLPRNPRRDCTELLRRLIPTFEESHRPSVEVCKHPYFLQFRLTDTGIAEVSTDSYVVVTDDLQLYHALANDEQAVINFNHLRMMNW